MNNSNYSHAPVDFQTSMNDIIDLNTQETPDLKETQDFQNLLRMTFDTIHSHFLSLQKSMSREQTSLNSTIDQIKSLKIKRSLKNQVKQFFASIKKKAIDCTFESEFSNFIQHCDFDLSLVVYKQLQVEVNRWLVGFTKKELEQVTMHEFDTLYNEIEYYQRIDQKLIQVNQAENIHQIDIDNDDEKQNKSFNWSYSHIVEGIISSILGKLNYHNGKLDQAQQELNHGHNLLKPILGSDSAVLSQIYNAECLLSAVKGDFETASACSQKSQQICKRNFSENHPWFADYYNALGIFEWFKGNYKECLINHQKAYIIRSKSFGTDHPDIAESLNNIGVVYNEQGLYQKALEAHLKSIETRKKCLGEHHPELVQSYINIGAVKNHQGKFHDALKYLFQALDILKKRFNDNHPNLGFIYNNIAYTYGYQNRNTEALEYHKNALQIRKKFFGPQHPDVSKSYMNLGVVYSTLGDHQTSIRYQKIALEIEIKCFGENNIDVARGYGNLGYSLSKLGKQQEALEYFTKALKIREEQFGENHPDVALNIAEIGYLHERQGRKAQAWGCQMKSLKIREKIFGIEHDEIFNTYNSLSTLAYKQGDLSNSEKLILKAMKLVEDNANKSTNDINFVRRLKQCVSIEHAKKKVSSNLLKNSFVSSCQNDLCDV